MAATGAALTSVGWIFSGAEAAAYPLEPAVRDTTNAILAFVVPGNDRYSQHQGMATDRPGGVTPGTAASLELTFNEAIPEPIKGLLGIEETGSIAIAALVNLFTVTAFPQSIHGPFAAPFANLSHQAKAHVFELLDTDPRLPGLPIEFAINAIPTLAAFAAFSEHSAFDRQRRVLTGRPVGWELTKYRGVSNGRNEFLGYYRGVDRVED